MIENQVLDLSSITRNHDAELMFYDIIARTTFEYSPNGERPYGMKAPGVKSIFVVTCYYKEGTTKESIIKMIKDELESYKYDDKTYKFELNSSENNKNENYMWLRFLILNPYDSIPTKCWKHPDFIKVMNTLLIFLIKSYKSNSLVRDPNTGRLNSTLTTTSFKYFVDLTDICKYDDQIGTYITDNVRDVLTTEFSKAFSNFSLDIELTLLPSGKLRIKAYIK